MADLVVPVFHQSFAEYVGRYDEPALERWEMGRLSQALMRSLRPWNVTLDDVSFSQSPAHAGQVHTRVELLNRTIALEVGIGQARLMVNSANWAQAETLVAINDAAASVIESVLGARIGSHGATIGFHFSVPGTDPVDLVRVFLNPSLEALSEPEVQSFGVSIYRADSSVVLDRSMVYPDALFMRLARMFPEPLTFKQIAEAMFADETRFLAILGLRVG